MLARAAASLAVAAARTLPSLADAASAPASLAAARAGTGALASCRRAAGPARGWAAQAATADDDDSAAAVSHAADVPAGSRRPGLPAVKVGMTQAWTAAGVRLPLTVLWFDAPAVTHIKSLTKDGVDAVQVSCGAVRPKNAHGRTTGHCARAGLGRTARHAVEFRVTRDAADGLALGTPLSAAHFAAGQYVDVVGTTIGKGFQGVMKRWGFGGQPASHGTSKAHRSAGGIGGCQDPGKVWKGKKMAGRMGGARRTAQSLFVYKVDPARNLLYVKGAVPGHKGSLLRVSDAAFKRFGGQPVPRPFPTWLGPPPADVASVDPPEKGPMVAAKE